MEQKENTYYSSLPIIIKNPSHYIKSSYSNKVNDKNNYLLIFLLVIIGNSLNDMKTFYSKINNKNKHLLIFLPVIVRNSLNDMKSFSCNGYYLNLINLKKKKNLIIIYNNNNTKYGFKLTFVKIKLLKKTFQINH